VFADVSVVVLDRNRDGDALIGGVTRRRLCDPFYLIVARRLHGVPLFPYTTLFRSIRGRERLAARRLQGGIEGMRPVVTTAKGVIIRQSDTRAEERVAAAERDRARVHGRSIAVGILRRHREVITCAGGGR